MFIFGRGKLARLVLNKLVYGNLSDIVKKATPPKVFEIFV